MLQSTLTDKEWQSLVDSTVSSLQADRLNAARTYTAPSPGTPAFAKVVDHTQLKPDADEKAIIQCCEEARQWNFQVREWSSRDDRVLLLNRTALRASTVCVRSHFVALAHEALHGSDVEVCSVVCFPEGTQSVNEKIKEGKVAVDAGAKELDFVINQSLLKIGSYTRISSELQALRQSFPQTTIKLILETSQLTPAQIVAGCLLASAANFDFVKTSTGFLGHGARVEHVNLMRSVAEQQGKSMGVKASGGIRTADSARSMLNAGATRLGLSGSVVIMSSSTLADVKGDGY